MNDETICLLQVIGCEFNNLKNKKPQGILPQGFERLIAESGSEK